MPGRVELEPDEIWLNGLRYKILPPIRASLTRPPGKVVIGDTTKDSHPNRSIVSWSDLRGGMGIERMDESTDINRVWWSTANLRGKKHLVPAPLATTTASAVAGVYNLGPPAELSSVLYVPHGVNIYGYTNTSDDWGSSLAALPAAATDAITARVGGTVYAVWACKTHYTRTADGSTFEDETDDIQYLESWDGRLWGIDNTGQLKFATDLTIGGTPTWTDDAQLPLPDDSVTDLLIDRDAAGEEILHCMTTVGLYAHDAANAKWVKTQPELPTHPDNGVGSVRWWDSLFIPAGLGIYRRRAGETTIVTTMGPDRDHGLPSDYRGVIIELAASHNDLLAAVDGTSAVARTVYSGSAFGDLAGGGHLTAAVPNSTGYSSILAWDGMGWMAPWISGSTDWSIDFMFVSNAYGEYRLWFGQNMRIHWIQLQRDITNPDQVSDYAYAASARTDYPIFNAGQSEVNKTAYRLLVDVAGASSDETITPYYQINSGGWTALTAITSDGVTSYDFPDSTTPTGTAFRDFQVRVDHARGSTTTNKADVREVALEYDKTDPAKWIHFVTIRLEEGYGGASMEEQFENLRSAVESPTSVEYTHRSRDADDAGTSNPYNYYVKVKGAEGLEWSGNEWKGDIRLVFVEV